MEKSNDSIILSLPFEARHVSIARLTASGVAAGIGFNIDLIEDIKVSIAEVCNKLVKLGSENSSHYTIAFQYSSGILNITFECEDKNLKCIFNDEKDELGLYIINALMDSVEFCTDNKYLLSMSKRLEENT